MGEDAITVYYKAGDGRIAEQMVFRQDEARLSLADVGLRWSFDTPDDAFKLGLEAYRIHLAHLFDPMTAVHTSNGEPLPHQIEAVYEIMLERQPLRFVVADDIGAGKTIMAGLLIGELLIRADAQRILILAPGGLTEQWQDELREKFGLMFTIFSRDQAEQFHSGNPFDDIDLLIARVDQLARSEALQEQITPDRWCYVHVPMAPHRVGTLSEMLRMDPSDRILGSRPAARVPRNDDGCCGDHRSARVRLPRRQLTQIVRQEIPR